MKKLTLPLLILASSLAACGGSSQNQGANAPVAVAPLPTAVSGTVTLRNPVPLSASATLHLRLLNVSTKPPTTIAESNVGGLTTMPANFELTFDRDKIDANAYHVLDAKIVDGERHYVSPRQYPVVTKGSGVQVTVEMTPEPTASELLESEYALLERAIGGMKRVQGAGEDDTSTTAWDGFFEKSGLRYIREITDYGDKGRSNFFYAYRDGKPMFVIKESVPALAERANAVSRAGWDDAGKLVVHTRRDGGSTGELSEGDAKALFDRAVAQYNAISRRNPNK